MNKLPHCSVSVQAATNGHKIVAGHCPQQVSAGITISKVGLERNESSPTAICHI